ncbi:MAG TPA: hypothetical protein VFA20_06610 [Myxococcaceae bacterium]|nr:hypothetical protein [Myxococcaceae bacterium]
MERRLAAALAAAWEAEVTAAKRMAALAERVLAPALRSRLLVQSAFCRAHACRLLARLSTNGRGPLPVPAPDDEPPPGPLEALVEEARLAKDAATRYRTAADLARKLGDLSSAWVCELNGTEEVDRASQLLAMAHEVEQGAHQDSFAV